MSAKGLGILTSLAGVLRRDRSSSFKRARRLLETAKQVCRDFRKTSSIAAMAGRIHCDLGYICFLCNDYLGAAAHFDQGIESCERAKEMVGLRIASSVKELLLARQTGHCDSRRLSDNLAFFFPS